MQVVSSETRAVFFDVGGTLLRADPPVAEVFARVAGELGHDLTVRDVEPHMVALDAYYEQEYLRDGDFWCSHERAVQIWLDMYALLCHSCGFGEDSQRVSEAVYRAYLDPACWSLYDDVEACLKGLKRRGFRLGVISNWDASLTNLLRGLAVLPYFDTVIASAEVGCRKPSSAIFEIALERMAVAPARAVHVGDLPEADGDGARGAGVRPIVVDRAGALEDCSYERVGRLTDLVSLL